MKKKEFNNNLTLGKRVISNLQQNSVQGGTNTVTAGTYIIVTTIKILTEYVTDPRICLSTVPDCTLTTQGTSTPTPTDPPKPVTT